MFPDVRVVLLGETVTLIEDPVGLTAMDALAFLDVFAELVAVTVTLVAALTVGAVKRPVLETVPAERIAGFDNIGNSAIFIFAQRNDFA